MMKLSGLKRDRKRLSDLLKEGQRLIEELDQKNVDLSRAEFLIWLAQNEKVISEAEAILQELNEVINNLKVAVRELKGMIDTRNYLAYVDNPGSTWNPMTTFVEVNNAILEAEEKKIKLMTFLHGVNKDLLLMRDKVDTSIKDEVEAQSFKAREIYQTILLDGDFGGGDRSGRD